MNNDDILKIENLNNNSNNFIIRWKMTSLCNYSCSFCIQGDKKKHITKSKGESSKLRMQICDNLIKFIENKINNNYKNLKIYLIGGEVTVLKDFIPIFDKLVNCSYSGKMTIQITTNLSSSDSTLKEIRNIILNCRKNRKLQISASYYKEFTTTREFMKKVKILHVYNNFQLLLKNKVLKKSKKNEIIITVGYPIVDDNDYKEFIKFKVRYFNYANKIFSIIIRRYKTNISNNVKNKLKKNIGTKKIKVTLKNNNELFFNSISNLNLNMNNNEIFNPHGMLCDSGVNNISINNLGDVSRCCSWSRETKYANIITDELELLTDKFICPGTMCSCDYYGTIMKKKK